MSAAFIDKCWFDPDLCGIEKLIFERHDDELDHEWHEIESIGGTEEITTMDIDIADFLFAAMKVHVNWVKFDCRGDGFTFEP